MTPIITVKNIGKSYTISHQGNKRANTLRDEMGGWFKNLTRKRRKEEYSSKEDFWALKDVSFNIEPGDRVGIIGRNGAGKSTLLKILSRITEPTTGEIKIKGRVASLLEVGTGFHPELSGRENIYLNGAILGLSRKEIKNKFDEIVAFSEVEKFLDTPVKRYSSGMYVRLAFAVAAHLEPEILIVDEVLAVGDAEFQKKCLGKMEDVSKNQKRTVLFVSHNMAAVQNLCNKGIRLEKGKLIFQGNINETISNYLTKANNTDLVVSLKNHPQRKIINNPMFVEFKVLDPRSMKPTDIVECGQDIIFDLEYDIKGCEISKIFIAFFYMGTRVMTISTIHDSSATFVKKGYGLIRCRLPNCTLAPKTYVLGLWGTRVDGEEADYIEDFFNLTVVDNNYFGNGVSIFPAQGYIIQKSEWRTIEHK